MTAATEVTAPSGLDQARALAAETEAARHSWAVTRESAAIIGWALGELTDALEVCDRLADPDDDIDPYSVRAPDMAWWDDPEAQALEFAEDEAAQYAEALRKRLSEYRDREAARVAGERVA